MSARVRLLPFQIAAGPWNMAADEALLASAVERSPRGVASLRFYGWSRPTLSLGYFQPSSLAINSPRLADLPWLRRPSGGAALVHHHELTYALALPPGPPWQAPGIGWISRFHDLIHIALAGLGIDTRLCVQERKPGGVLCFLHQMPGDLLTSSGYKVAGSAQRKQRGALLQHGGILLGQSPFTPELPGIAELSSRPIASESLQLALSEELARANGWRIEGDDWTPEEQLAIQRILPRYESAAWNSKR
jgi:lipoate-protein ligase A